MTSINLARPQVSARKYDIITALGTYALARGKHDQRIVLRLLTLVTARYNWQRNMLAVGQREIARLWSVDERTVKRDIAKFRGMGWLVVRRQGARSRVTEYGLDIDRVLADTRDDWPKVGPDYEVRMQGKDAAPPSGAVVPLPLRGAVPMPEAGSGTSWDLARGILHREDAANYGSWFHALKAGERTGGRLVLVAPSRFHAAYVQSHFALHLLNVCQSVDGDIFEVAVIH